MATGVQSGFRTTAGSQPGAAGSGPYSKIPFQKGLEKFLSGFTSKQKIAGMIVFCLMIAAIISLAVYQKSTAYVPLYPEKLSSADVGKISFELDRMSIKYTIVEGGAVLMVPPSCKTLVRNHMAQLHLPQRLLKKAEVGSSMFRTTKEMEYNRQMALQTELTESIRTLEGIADAYVTIARPERDYFEPDNAVTTASVIVSMVPGSRLVPAQVKGITRLVAASVPDLEENDVTVVDQSGIVINARDDDAAYPLELTVKEQERKISYEQYMQRKVQGILDKAFGPNKAIVVIDTTIDASSSRTESIVVGDATSNGSVIAKIKEEKESYSDGNKESSDAGTQMSFLGTAGKNGKGQSYNKNDTVRIMDVNKRKTETVTPAGAVKRITASVLVDNLSPSHVDKVREIVKGAIGYDDEQRNDTVTVASLPFTSNVVQELQRQRIPASGLSGKGQSSALSPLHLFVLNAVIILLLVPFIVFSTRRRESTHRRSGLFLAAAQSATSCEITDLNTEKYGRSNECAETGINTSERFEQFATERPSEVAGLLKSTWLAEKMR